MHGNRSRYFAPIQSNGGDDEQFIRTQLAVDLKWQNSDYGCVWYMRGMETLGIYTDTVEFIGNAPPSDRIDRIVGLVYVSHTPCVYS
ncbi:hypothetical protein PILCRDRAFT_821720 [Piloderma croceum F 1598]|uniref:Uncharacterized protein n=1 Tax=Piloderma croceum (strain F 1598) TaxID=765440 RepID=A0A0C3FQ05_PILCF|nr:hypothetical protein PILCRDRAFT_821720 [Piloderma croceum F 1598]